MQYLLYIKAACEAGRNAENAAAMQQYMRGLFPYFGIKTPQRKAIIKTLLQQHGPPETATLPQLAAALWQQPEREHQYIAVELLQKQHRHWTEDYIRLFEQLLVQKSWWDTVDIISSNLTGPYFRKFPAQSKAITSRWVRSDNIWLQRAALLFQLLYREHTDVTLLFGYIRRLSHSKEFFIQKAIGWSLRQYAKTDPAAVSRFIQQQPLPALSVREARKHL